MRKLTTPLLSAFFLLIYLLSACDSMDDHYSMNPNLRLGFSQDTLSFDTVFTTIGSATRQVMIYNPHSEPLNIETILLASGGATGFRINVDGRKGDLFNNIGIQAKDSMYVFVEVTVDPNGVNQPLLLEDSVVFSVNGIRQSVVLEAYGQDVNLYKGGVTITKDTILRAERPYLIYDSLVVAEGAKLTIDKGTCLYMHHKANVVVYGTLETQGTQEAPVTFRGDRLDFILNDILPYDRTPGQWGGIFFKAESFDNRMEHTIVRNGSTGLTFLTSTPDRSKLTLANSQITNMKNNLFTAINCRIDVANSELTNAGGAVTALIGGEYTFTHCTLSNHITLVKNDSIRCLALSNKYSDKQFYPLKASFVNSIIEGGREENILLSAEEGTAFSYRFDHCVIRSKKEIEKNEHFTNSFIVNRTPLFYKMGGEDNKYSFDYRLAADTVVGVGKADPVISQKYPIDRLGVERLTSATGPTIGAYEFVPLEEDEE